MIKYDIYSFLTRHRGAEECARWLSTLGISKEFCEIVIDDDHVISYPCSVTVKIEHGKITKSQIEVAIQQVDGGMHVSHYMDNHYDRQDIESAPASICIVVDDRASRSGAIYRTAYDYTLACKKCGIGRAQTGPLVARVAKKRGDRRLIRTRDADWLMHKECSDKLCAVVPEAKTQLAILSEKSHAVSAKYVQIRVASELPSMLLEPSGLVIESDNPFYCGLCKRGGYFGGGPIFRPTYRMTDLKEVRLMPFMVTAEKESYSDLSGKLADGCEYVSPGWLVARTDVALTLFDMSIQSLSIVPVGIVE